MIAAVAYILAVGGCLGAIWALHRSDRRCDRLSERLDVLERHIGIERWGRIR